MDPGTSGPPWLAITIARISLVGVVITAMVGPLVVERHKPDRITREPTEPAVIAKHATDAVALIQSAISLVQSEISDLQTRIGRLETLQMADAHGQR